MQLKKIQFIYLPILIISCTLIKTEKVKTAFEKITFTTGLCYGTCPQTAGYIDDSLNFYFYGGEYADRHSLPVGYYKGTINDSLWLEINTKAIALKQYFDSSWEKNSDAPPIEINFIDSATVARRILGDDMMPKNVFDFLKWLQNLSKKILLQKITDSIFFQKTQIRIESFRIPPPPPIDSIQFFTPPKKKIT
jgi:hypothetical protein